MPHSQGLMLNLNILAHALCVLRESRISRLKMTTIANNNTLRFNMFFIVLQKCAYSAGMFLNVKPHERV